MQIKKWLSYLLPLQDRVYHSPVNGRLEINWQHGRRVLDSAVSNYSYGSLQRILQRGLEEANFQPTAQSVLVLGLGGGSLIETLRNRFAYQHLITCVEIDPSMIQIAKEVFQIERFAPIEIVCEDAATYVFGSKHCFDWVIVDIFIGDSIPACFTHPHFLSQLIRVLSATGTLLFNTMHHTLPSEQLLAMASYLQTKGLATRILHRIENTNNVLLATKQTQA
ncbi:MAG: methyltransferase domain-containing protein [Cytophagales bacterium]|nr:methyltransferase domain-containing protein [Bernardetiaceae bacterium]MDW8204185.1 methyltransferase domain-containing protein [Cytophagales bacterium]